MTHRRNLRFDLILSFSLLLALGLHSTKLQADQITLKNGDRLTGSLIKSDKKTLTLKFFGKPITVPWTEIESIGSEVPIHLLLRDGQAIKGQVSTEADQIRVRTEDAGTVLTNKDSIQEIRSEAEQVAYLREIERLRNPGLLDLWSGYLDTGLATTQGNTDTVTLNLGLNAARTTKTDKTSVYLTSLYATNSTTGISLTTANAIRGGLRYDANVNDRTFGFGFTDLEFDEFQDLDLRFVVGGGLGRHLLKSSKTNLTVFGGGSMNKEFFSTDLQRTRGEVLFGEEISHKISTITSLQQKFVVYPSLSNGGSYRLNWDSSAVTKLNSWLSWQVTLSDRFLSDPIPGNKKNDLLITTGFRVTFAKE
ncbi:MAG: DUF481 domain-containing protein [Acidobacteriota bacterium]